MSQIKFCSITIIIALFCSFPTFSQTFYVNAWKNMYQNENLAYQLKVTKCDTLHDSVALKLYTCSATGQPFPNWVDSSYNDIAIDKDQNIWYLTLGGFLYTRNLNDTSSCRYIGTFSDTPATFSGLVSDSSGALYAAGNASDYCYLYKYDNFGFKRLGVLPKGVHCIGDLFFYKYRLFITCTGSRADSYFLYEISLQDPGQSCYYMPLTGIAAPWGAFSATGGKNHRVFITTTDTSSYTSSSLLEIDIPSRKILGELCTYPFVIKGAATYYPYTKETTSCPVFPNSVSEITNDSSYITIYNPSTQILRINTNISQYDIRTIELYDLYGKRLRQFITNNFPNNITLADLPNSMYLLKITAKNGKQWKEKVVKSSRW